MTLRFHTAPQSLQQQGLISLVFILLDHTAYFVPLRDMILIASGNGRLIVSQPFFCCCYIGDTDLFFLYGSNGLCTDPSQEFNHILWNPDLSESAERNLIAKNCCTVFKQKWAH